MTKSFWLTQRLMAELFQTTKQNISLHIQNIYNLDLIISVSYRIKSHVATRFRQWTTQRLREYIVKGFVLDDERLKNPDQPFDYFDELLRRIQDIRTSERRFYQKMKVRIGKMTDKIMKIQHDLKRRINVKIILRCDIHLCRQNTKNCQPKN